MLEMLLDVHARTRNPKDLETFEKIYRGFNGIGVRWISLYMKGRKEQASFESWLQKNADAAWQARRESDQLS